MIKVSFGQLKPTSDTRAFRLYARAVLAGTEKKRSLKNGKLEANRASETEERTKERLRIGCKKDKARRITKKSQEEKKMLSEIEDHEK